MFFASSHMQVGPVLMSTRLAVNRGARIYAAERMGMSADTALFPATQVSARPITVLWFFLSGTATFEHDGQVTHLEAPCLVAIPEHWSEGADGKRAVRVLTTGAPYASVQVHFREECRQFRIIDLDPRHVAEVSAMHRQILDAAPEEGLAPLRRLLGKLVSFGLVPTFALTAAEATFYQDPTTARVWQALQRRYTALDASPSLKAMAAEVGLSARHTHRIMTTIFGECLMPPGGFREATINVRLSLASILLSKSSLSVVEVARAVGYLHPETLANAFRHVGLPSPAEIKRTYAVRSTPTLPEHDETWIQAQGVQRRSPRMF